MSIPVITIRGRKKKGSKRSEFILFSSLRPSSIGVFFQTIFRTNTRPVALVANKARCTESLADTVLRTAGEAIIARAFAPTVIGLFVLPAYGYTDRDGSQEGDQKKRRKKDVSREA